MDNSPIPFVVIGDAPTQPSGLARIARDLCTLIHRHLSDEVQLLQLGLQQASGSLAWAGPWPLVTFSSYARMGGDVLGRVLKQHRRKGIVFVLWDAHFSMELYSLAKEEGWDFWIYPPVDAVNKHGVFGGPAAEVIKKADRVLAYGEWAAGVLSKIRGEPVEWRPLGIGNIWQPTAEKSIEKIIGCVATNQPRKDLNLYCETIAELRGRGHDVKAWLVTDALVKQSGSMWSIPELRKIHGLYDPPGVLTVYTNGDNLGDVDLVRLYQQSSVTIAPGMGEGFGYPIVESMACGVHVIAVNYAGAVELCPRLVQPRAWRAEGAYALLRPVVKATDVADLVEYVWQNYSCVNGVERYRWSSIWPAWERWILTGVQAYRSRTSDSADAVLVGKGGGES